MSAQEDQDKLREQIKKSSEEYSDQTAFYKKTHPDLNI